MQILRFLYPCQTLALSLLLLVSIGLQAKKQFSNEDSLLVKYKIKNVQYPHSQHTGWMVSDSMHYQLKLDTLRAIRFWRRVMNLSGDSSLGYTLPERRLLALQKTSRLPHAQTDLYTCYKDSLKQCFCLDTQTKIVFRSGLKDFYNFYSISKYLDSSIREFLNQDVNPWYAQTILMIESPNRHQHSIAGAYGPFQLMPDVARKFGLHVSAQRDDRTNISLAAEACAKLLKQIAIPNSIKILESHGYRITQEIQEALWFKLFVLHVYHAGAFNVSQAMETACPEEPGMNLIFKLWQTRAGKFQNASQNYSQLAIAAWYELDRHITYIP